MDWDAPTESPVSPILSDQQQQQQGSFSDLLSSGYSETPANPPAPARSGNNGNIDDIMNLFNTSSNTGAQTFVSSPQQQNTNVMNDFTNDLFGSTPTQQQAPKPTNTSAAKDPFADLF